MNLPLHLRSLFNSTLIVSGVSIPAKQTKDVIRTLRPHMLTRTGVRPVRDQPNGDKLILLNTEIPSLDALDPPAEVPENAIFEKRVDVPLDYSHYNMDQVLKTILPPDVIPPVSYEIAGHIAHLNLREELVPYKTTIAQVMLDKSPRLKSVVNKTSEIHSEFRVAPLELLAGDPDMVCEVHESNCRFRLDYSSVYWNSRLQSEHARMIESFDPRDIVYDAFAGVGPFAVPAAKRGCTVFASDLNPESFRWLKENVKINKVSSRVSTFNMDAREFVKEYLRPAASPEARAHVLMNLPASAPEFCDMFAGIWAGGIADVNTRPPLVHCYGFSSADDPAADIEARIAGVIGMASLNADTRVVRDVAPRKVMLCVSFEPDMDILIGTSADQKAKKQKL